MAVTAKTRGGAAVSNRSDFGIAKMTPQRSF
jgi:hypothetical protein